MKRRHVLVLPACGVLALRLVQAGSAMEPELQRLIALEQALK